MSLQAQCLHETCCHCVCPWSSWACRMAKVKTAYQVPWFAFMTAHILIHTMFWQNVVMRRSITLTIWTCMWTNEWARDTFPIINYPAKIIQNWELRCPEIPNLSRSETETVVPPPVVLVEIFHTLQASRDALRLHGAATWTSNRSEAFRLIQEWWEWWKVYWSTLRNVVFLRSNFVVKANTREDPWPLTP